MYRTLIDGASVVAILDHPEFLLVDCRHDLGAPQAGELAYQRGHIGRAAFAHADRDLAGERTGTNGRHPLPERSVFLDFLRGIGVNDSTQVVAYDASAGLFAARLWWLMRWVGHEAVAVLDGGIAAFIEAGGRLGLEPPPNKVGQITDRPPLVTTVGADDLLANLTTPTRLVVDARAAERYRGEVEPLDPVAGHIPGARNRPHLTNLSQAGRFLPPENLLEQWRETLRGAEPKNVVHQCGSGITACHNLLAMEVAGLPHSQLYAGSWSEWCADPTRPIERGDAAT